MFYLSEIAHILNLQQQIVTDTVVDTLLTDSRKLTKPETTLFFALPGARRDGSFFLSELYKKGVRNFVVQQQIDTTQFADANFLLVPNVLCALQLIARHQREKFNYPVIGITGSNGKTIVKEWLYFLLQEIYHIVRSPKSYNSQIGVPLSVWQLTQMYNLGIFEAGISQPHEMSQLQKIIQPTIGILTNIGTAHDDGFISIDEKISEKIKLFINSDIVITQGDNEKIMQQLSLHKIKTFSWGYQKSNDITIISITKKEKNSCISLCYQNQQISFIIPFTDNASIENALTCCSVLFYMQVDTTLLQEKMQHLPSVSMRLSYLKGINNCVILNDSYSADTNALKSALEWMHSAAYDKSKTVVLSDFAESKGMLNFYNQILILLKQNGINKLVTIGKEWNSFIKERPTLLKDTSLKIHSFYTTEDFINTPRALQFINEIILVKGARNFHFEDIVSILELKQHQTVLEINLNAIGHNLKQVQNHLKPATKIMVMVKAFAYGSGAIEIANILQFHKVDYLGVAYADEGVELKKAGISIPIMIMNPEESAFDSIIENQLEPNIYSLPLLLSFQKFVQDEGIFHYPIHLEMETGMNRLGFSEETLPQLCTILQDTEYVKVQSVFTHLAASEDEVEDEFTLHQFSVFEKMNTAIKQVVPYPILTHIANTAAIMRFPNLQLNMVRLGIGLYGVGNNSWGLQPAITFKSTIAQIKYLKKGDTVSYNRKGIIEKDTTIATIRLGYADGYSRKFGYGNGEMLVNGVLAPVIGTVCMDMTMIDVSHVPNVQAGNEVIIFGKNPTVISLAKKLDTIPYEIMTNISQRVKRIYFLEE